MEYTVTFNGNSYDLPKYTIAIAEKIERQEQINQGQMKLKDKCKLMYELCEDFIGKDKVVECIGKFNEVDPNELNILYLEIVTTYNKPVENYNNERFEGQLSGMQLDKLMDIATVMSQAEKITPIKK